MCKAFKTNFFLKLWKVPDIFFRIHKHSSSYLLTSSVKTVAPSSPREGRYLGLFLASFKAKSFRTLERGSSFQEQVSLFGIIFQSIIWRSGQKWRSFSKQQQSPLSPEIAVYMYKCICHAISYSTYWLMFAMSWAPTVCQALCSNPYDNTVSLLYY